MPKTSGRLLSLLSLLQARRDWPGALLAERLAVSPRTVRRDVDRLRELGYPITAFKGPDGGYRLDAGTELPPLLFDDEQAVALAVALQLATGSGGGIQEAAARALTTVRQLMPARLRRRIDTVQVTAVERPAARRSPQVGSRLLMTLGAAVHAREVLRFDYSPVDPAAAGHPDHGDRHDASAPRRAEPHHLLTWGGRWYLVGWDLDRDDWRTFRADRITPRTSTGPRFAPRPLPGGDVAAFVTRRFRGVDVSTGSGDDGRASDGASNPAVAGPDGWPCTGEVLLDLPAGEVSPYTGDGIVEALGPDRCRLILGSWSWAGLAAAIGRFDADIEIVGPAGLRDAFAQLGRRYTEAATREPADPGPGAGPGSVPRPGLAT